MKFGLFLPMHYPNVNRSYSDLLAETIEISQAAEDLGFHGVFIPEHHFINYICNPSALKVAIHVANHTKRLRIGTAVIVLPWYHPLALAEEIALVDHISGGRLDVGVARGANKYEFDRLGMDITQSRAMSDESIDIMVRALTEEDWSYEGNFWKFDTMTTMPRPVQKPHPPFWITAQSPEGLRGAARRGFNVLNSPLYGCFAPYSAFEYTMEEYNKALAETGTQKQEFGVLRRTFIAETQKEAEKKVDAVLRHWGMYMAFFKRGDLNFRADIAEVPVQRGDVTPARFDDIPLDDLANRYDDPILTDPEGAIRKIERYQAAGATYFLANIAFGIPQNEVLKSMELFARHVMPHFQQAPEPHAAR